MMLVLLGLFYQHFLPTRVCEILCTYAVCNGLKALELVHSYFSNSAKNIGDIKLCCVVSKYAEHLVYENYLIFIIIVINI